MLMLYKCTSMRILFYLQGVNTVTSKDRMKMSSALKDRLKILK